MVPSKIREREHLFKENSFLPHFLNNFHFRSLFSAYSPGVTGRLGQARAWEDITTFGTVSLVLLSFSDKVYLTTLASECWGSRHALPCLAGSSS